MRFLQVRLRARAGLADALRAFYGGRLGLACDAGHGDDVAVRIGETSLEFVAGEGDPFYHLALLAPGDRFDAALEAWRPRVDLLPDPRSGDAAFDFPAWDATALYFHDPAGNIVELIAHRGVGDSGRAGRFDAAQEVVGLSELGLVGDPAAIAGRLRQALDLELWDGEVERGGRLGFVGSRARTFVVCALHRGWLPTGRPAQRHPVDAVIEHGRAGQAQLEDGCYRVVARPQ